MFSVADIAESINDQKLKSQFLDRLKYHPGGRIVKIGGKTSEEQVPKTFDNAQKAAEWVYETATKDLKEYQDPSSDKIFELSNNILQKHQSFGVSTGDAQSPFDKKLGYILKKNDVNTYEQPTNKIPGLTGGLEDVPAPWRFTDWQNARAAQEAAQRKLENEAAKVKEAVQNSQQKEESHKKKSRLGRFADAVRNRFTKKSDNYKLLQ